MKMRSAKHEQSHPSPGIRTPPVGLAFLQSARNYFEGLSRVDTLLRINWLKRGREALQFSLLVAAIASIGITLEESNYVCEYGLIQLETNGQGRLTADEMTGHQKGLSS